MSRWIPKTPVCALDRAVYDLRATVMANPDRVQSVVDAAERAAAAKDLAAAERLLREAVQLQETDLGPHHSDLANTLNNLAVVCEMADQPAEAEACYRRAYTIAAAALPADHPFVVTSRENLTEFCKARGKPVDLPLPVQRASSAEAVEQQPTEPPPIAATPSLAEIPPVVETPPAVATPPVVATPRVETRARPSTGMSSRLPIAIAGVVVLVLVVIAVRRFADESSSAPNVVTSANDGTSPQERPAAPAASAAPATPPPVASTTDPKASSSKAVPPSRPGNDKPERGASTKRSAPPPGLVVATALLCQRFAPRGSPDWQCDPARGSVARGTFVFYTRIKTARPVAVQHRWYRGDVLHQSVSLDVSANQVAGYRTYSRYTVPQSGAWRVELRTMDGALLHEERFEVR
jgi:hypothetical protein